MKLTDEVVSTPTDKRRPGTGLPRHRSSREAATAAPKQGRLWAEHDVLQAGGVWGSFPRGFLRRALQEIRATSHHRTLHVCSGSLGSEVLGVRLDLRPSQRPDVIGDGRSLPFRDSVFDAVLIDPPWSVEYARDLYETDYPRPSHLLREAARVLTPGGLIGFVHFIVPNPPSGTRLMRVRGITQGCGYRIRALSIFRKELPSLFDCGGAR